MSYIKKERVCPECGKTHVSGRSLCNQCKYLKRAKEIERTCPDCNKTHIHHREICVPCAGKRRGGVYTKERVCPHCNKTHISRQNSCRECYNTSVLQKMRVNRATNIELVYEHLGEGYDGCVVCGITDRRVHCFHHLEPDKKEFDISVLLTSHRNVDRILKEIDKCALMCMNCHTIEHSCVDI